MSRLAHIVENLRTDTDALQRRHYRRCRRHHGPSSGLIMPSISPLIIEQDRYHGLSVQDNTDRDRPRLNYAAGTPRENKKTENESVFHTVDTSLKMKQTTPSTTSTSTPRNIGMTPPIW